jgi:hypothetical protein
MDSPVEMVIIYRASGLFATIVLYEVLLRYWRLLLRLILPSDYDRIKVVNSFDELVKTPMGPRINALCWQRTLDGNFNELAELLHNENEITPLDEELFSSLRLSPHGQRAAEILLQDRDLMRGHGLSPNIECIPGYHRDEGPVPTDVYSFHVDSATVQTDTYLCCYNGPATEGLRNDQAQRHIDIAATRAELLKQFQQEEEPSDFDTYLKENCYDLHYAGIDNAVPFSFGIGNLWRVAVQYPGSPVPPCIHRAPATAPGQLPRLLLIS